VDITIAVDAMGGDHGPAVTVPGSLAAIAHCDDLNLILVGNREQIEAQLTKAGHGTDRITVRSASQTVTMDEDPARALRGKKDSSMRVAINLVKSGEADACLSAGNTGALMATSRFVLKTLPGIDRPAIVAALPSLRGHVHVLDLGANVDSPPELLLQFAIMGSVLVKHVEHKSSPSIGLLNIGVEDLKGNDIVRQAAELLHKSDLNYCGFVEGDAIYTGGVDVIVCDGFAGNVALKTSEGLATMISSIMKDEFKKNVFRKFAGMFALPIVNAFRKKIDHRRYNGATLVGLNGLVIKSHGGADALGFRQALLVAATEVREQVIGHISSELSQFPQAVSR
jgi:glycerol-3-phosphate acyltransferase PlsX